VLVVIEMKTFSKRERATPQAANYNEQKKQLTESTILNIFGKEKPIL